MTHSQARDEERQELDFDHDHPLLPLDERFRQAEQYSFDFEQREDPKRRHDKLVELGVL